MGSDFDDANLQFEFDSFNPRSRMGSDFVDDH